MSPRDLYLAPTVSRSRAILRPAPRPRHRHKQRYKLLLSVIIIWEMLINSGSALAGNDFSGSKLAIQFTSFCLGRRLDQAAMFRRAHRVGALLDKTTSFDGDTRIVWRNATSPYQFRYAFEVSDNASQHLRIIGCSVSAQGMSVASVIASLAEPSRLGRPNDTASPSLVARNAGWFFVKTNEPNWVSVMEIPPLAPQNVVVGISTHQRPRP